MSDGEKKTDVIEPGSEGASQDANQDTSEGISELEHRKKRGQRNVALALMIGAFVVIIYAVTILRIGGSAAERSF